MHRALLRVCMTIFAIVSGALFLAVLIEVADKATISPFCLSSSPNGSYPCWDWKFDNNTPYCMFNLIFASAVLLGITVLVFFISALWKCLFPEFALVAQRSMFCRCISRYSCVALNFTSGVLAVSFISFALRHRKSSTSCDQTADLANRCFSEGSCLSFLLIFFGFVFSLLASLLSAWDARFWYISGKEKEEREEIYQSYKDYSSIQDFNNF